MGEPLSQILIVSDTEENRRLITTGLEPEGYELTLAESAPRGIKSLVEESFDLVLFEVSSSGTGGYNDLAEITAHSTLLRIPVMALLPSADAGEIPRCINMGADDCLVKPIDSATLREHVSASLEKKKQRAQEREYLRTVEAEKRRYDRLLDMVFPPSIAEELKTTNTVQPRRFDNVAILFADVVDFTAYCSQRGPDEVLANLQEMVVACEAVAAKHNLQKVKTIGDCFMAAAGLLKLVENPVLESVRCGLEMISLVRMLSAGWTLRVGVHIGSVITGMVGYRQYLYDVFGDTVNTAAHIESFGKPGAVNLSPEAWAHVASMFQTHSAGFVNLKTKGQIEIYCITPEAAAASQ